MKSSTMQKPWAVLGKRFWQQMNRSVVAMAIALVSAPATAAQLDFDLVVTSAATNGNSTALRFDGETGEFLSVFAIDGQVDDPRDIVIVPTETDIVQLKNGDDRILTFDARTGEFIAEVSFQPDLNPGGGVFGPNGNYFVGARTSGAIAEFDSETGDFVDDFVSPEQVDFPRGFDFSQDGEFFYLGNGADPATGSGGGSLVKFDGMTGEILDANFVNDPALSPLDVVTGDDGSVFVSSEFPFGADNSVGTVRRYDATTGDLIQVFDAGTTPAGEPLLNSPRGIGFGPDDLLYVSSTGTDSVVRFDPATGEFVDVFAEFPLLNGQALTFVPTQESSTVPEPTAIVALLALGFGFIGIKK